MSHLTFIMEQSICLHESGGGLAETGGLAVAQTQWWHTPVPSINRHVELHS